MRMAMSEAIRARIEGQPGAFAAAVLTGDRSGLDADYGGKHARGQYRASSGDLGSAHGAY